MKCVDSDCKESAKYRVWYIGCYSENCSGHLLCEKHANLDNEITYKEELEKEKRR